MRAKTLLTLTIICLLCLGGAAVALAKEAQKAPKAAAPAAHKVIATTKAPAAIGPYSQAIEAGKTVYVSGQLPIDPATNAMPKDVAAQAKQSMENIKAILEAAGSSMEQVVMVNIYMHDLNQFGVVNDVYAKYFKGNFPARATVQVARLPKDAAVEISAIAVKK